MHIPAINNEGVENLQSSRASILVVDDFEQWRVFVGGFLSQYPNVRVVGFATDGSEAVQKAAELGPDLILLDIKLPNASGINVAAQIRERVPGAAILFLSNVSDPEVVQAALAAGGRGYVLKTKVTRDLVTAVDAVLRDELFVSRELADLDAPN
jgi:DNA-binding NarL/FixJ family response regulator